ncbi:MAG TPA: aminoglycoside phosphotransferase family protein [Puia sp.]|nr:aminoglycoside phosphotransferase family protein [Puia sp.]
MMETTVRAFLPDIEHFSLSPVGSGLIHRTWKLEVAGNEAYILQAVNTDVFTRPEAIAHNLDTIGRWLAVHHPDYLFAAPLRTASGDMFYRDADGVLFRMFPFVPGSRTYDVVTGPEQAYEAARQFGLFTRNLHGLDAARLERSLPGFHDLGVRYGQFDRAVREGDKDRIRASRDLIAYLQEQKGIVDTYLAIQRDPAFHLRVTHHDTKISNVLFDSSDKGLCVIDLDTVMPGYFISDVGDMIRTYVSPASEEEADFDKVLVRGEMYRAIEAGYLEEMGDVLSAREREHFAYGGLFMVYMQALRFLADHLNGDVYYGARYEGQNYIRAANQVSLLRKLVHFGALAT